MEKHEEVRYLKRTQKDYTMSFKLQIVQEIERIADYKKNIINQNKNHIVTDTIVGIDVNQEVYTKISNKLNFQSNGETETETAGSCE